MRHLEKMFAQLDIVMRRLVLMHAASLSDDDFEKELSFIAQQLRYAKAQNKEYKTPLSSLLEGLESD